MGIHYELTNFAKRVTELPQQPIVLNDLSSVTEKDRQTIDQLTTSVFNQTDVFSNEPACECGRITGGYNLGIVCSSCNTPVAEMFSKNLAPRVWIRNPAGVALLINPMVWLMLSFKFTTAGFNLVEWLCNTDYVPPGNKPQDVIDSVMELGIPRGYNNFVNNFDDIVERLSNLKRFAKSKNDDFLALVREQRESVFSPYLPLPNKALLIREDTNVGSYIDQMVVSIVDAIQTIKSIDTPTAAYSVRQKENRTIKTIVKLAKFYYDSFHLLLAKKQGLIRRHNCGTRGHWTSRSVISSNTKPHNYDELEVSWGQAVTLLTVHLKNKLFKQGYTPNEASALLYAHTNKYHAELDRLMQEILDESAYNRGLRGVYVRNPSLTRGSTQALWFAGYKKDPNDQTSSLSILDVVPYNAKLLALTVVMQYDNSPELLEHP